jgi:iron complex outermembrane receptor protein/vitamin B12 transporter
MRNKFLLSISICGVLILYTASSSGQEESPGLSNPETLDPVVVTGTAYPAELSKSTGSVTVITGEEIEASHAVSVGELLEQVPGLYVDQPASRGGVTSVYIRGGDPNFTLVLIDGVKVNDPTNSRGGSFDFSALSTDDIERIEIVRDPMSSLYGSDALSGVINIITKKGEGKPKATAEAMGGRYGQYQFLGGISGAGPFYDYSVTGSWLDDGEQVEGSTFKSPSVTASLGLINRDDMEITSTFRYSHIDSTSFPDDSGGPEFAVLRTTDDRNIDQLLLGLGYTHSPSLWWEYGIKLSFYNTKEKFSSPGVAPGERDPFGIPPNEADSDYKNYDANITSTFSPYEGVDIVAGFEAEFQDGSSRGMILGDFPLPAAFDLSRYILSPYLEVQFGMVENLYIVLGAREDFPEGFDPAFSPRAGVSYKIAATDTILRGSWGEGFKLPSFFSLANPIVGNPGLVPEESRSLDLGITQNLWDDKLGAQFNVYYNEFKNLIDFEEGPPPILVNRSRVTVKGFEIIGNIRPWEELSLSGSVSYADSNIKGTDEELRNRPRWWGELSLLYSPSPTVKFSLDAVFTGSVPDSSIPTGDVALDPYDVYNVALTWTPFGRVSMYVAVDNLFNEEYEQFVGFPAPGVSPRAGIRLTF